MGLWVADGPALRSVAPAVQEETCLRSHGLPVADFIGVGPSPRNCCGKGLGRTGCRRFAPPSVSEKIPDFLAYLKDSRFQMENEDLEKKGAGCGHQSSGDSCSGGNVVGFLLFESLNYRFLYPGQGDWLEEVIGRGGIL